MPKTFTVMYTNYFSLKPGRKIGLKDYRLHYMLIGYPTKRQNSGRKIDRWLPGTGGQGRSQLQRAGKRHRMGNYSASSLWWRLHLQLHKHV